MDDEKLYQVSLSLVPDIGDITAKTLLSYRGSAKEIFKKSKNQLAKIPGIGLINGGKIKSFSSFNIAEAEIHKCKTHHVEILFFTDDGYPKKLKHAPDSPTILYYKEKGNLNNHKTVSVVGTRKSTECGRKFTKKIIEQLSAHNVLIISGLAYGIDYHAHKAALQYGLDTIGVMASGLDIIYLSMHRSTAMEMLQHGGLLTEFKIGEKPEAHNFPSRNRIIAGMSDVTIVIEAAKKGGALITAEIANSYNRDVFALPGDLGKKFSEGCINLIKINKAHLLTSAEDIEDIMNWEAHTSPIPHEEKCYAYSKLTSEERAVIETLKSTLDGLILDELSWKSQIPLNKLASILLNLEFNGIVKTLPGKKYKLT
jgi:DNA processing protein